MAAAAGTVGLMLACATQLPASAQPDPGIDTGSSVPASAAPAVARIGGQIVRCDTGEGNLGGSEARAPLTLPEVTTCSHGTPLHSPVGPAPERRHDPLR
jgi:hypothetical protein